MHLVDPASVPRTLNSTRSVVEIKLCNAMSLCLSQNDSLGFCGRAASSAYDCMAVSGYTDKWQHALGYFGTDTERLE